MFAALQTAPWPSAARNASVKTQGCFRLATTATTATTTPREISRSHKHEPSTCNCHDLPLRPCCYVARVADSKPDLGLGLGLDYGFGFPFPVPVQCVAAIMQMPGSQVDRLLIAICI
nr:uncharacterized protein LOC108074527 [Drosophila kikkawai]